MRPVNIDCRFILLVTPVAFTLARRHGDDRPKNSALLQSPLIRWRRRRYPHFSLPYAKLRPRGNHFL
jgi:hypothetical protein